jgi:hypothetical protein
MSEEVKKAAEEYKCSCGLVFPNRDKLVEHQIETGHGNPPVSGTGTNQGV